MNQDAIDQINPTENLPTLAEIERQRSIVLEQIDKHRAEWNTKSAPWREMSEFIGQHLRRCREEYDAVINPHRERLLELYDQAVNIRLRPYHMSLGDKVMYLDEVWEIVDVFQMNERGHETGDWIDKEGNWVAEIRLGPIGSTRSITFPLDVTLEMRQAYLAMKDSPDE